MEIFLLLFFILVLAIFLGLELISKIPSTLHTPLMSGANAISGITLVGALALETGSDLQMILAFSAIVFASINVFGGYFCLLYTSPSPRDRTRSRMPSSA